jgi:hypothetical protein
MGFISRNQFHLKYLNQILIAKVSIYILLKPKENEDFLAVSSKRYLHPEYAKAEIYFIMRDGNATEIIKLPYLSNLGNYLGLGLGVIIPIITSKPHDLYLSHLIMF